MQVVQTNNTKLHTFFAYTEQHVVFAASLFRTRSVDHRGIRATTEGGHIMPTMASTRTLSAR